MLTSHLTPERWTTANRHLVAKALSEFAHERLVSPIHLGGSEFEVRAGSVYRFRAELKALDHWVIDEASLTRDKGPLDALDLVLDLREQLGLSDKVLPVYLEEITATLAAAAYKLEKADVPVSELVKADLQIVEAAVTEGHPCFVANSGRLGFGVEDYRAYAPETGRNTKLVWLAAKKDVSTFNACHDTSYEDFIRAEAGTLADAVDLEEYHLIPVHPWQWEHKLAVTFAGELASGRLVHLGESDDNYQPQQSIRTLFNTSDPAKHYVKTALSVLNMGFMRGLSAAYMEVTPAINDWLEDLVGRDPVLQECRFGLLRERASVGYLHRQLEDATQPGSPYRKMLAALWRESPVTQLGPGEQVATMAALLHVDRDGRSYAAALIEQSGLTAQEWLRRYLDAYLVPVVHCLFAYDLAFMPHGENVILVLDNGVVTRTLFKDLAEEIALMDPEAVLPAEVQRIQVDVPHDLKLLSLFTDVFDCFFRFLSATLDEAGTLSEQDFWRTVADCIKDYQGSRPELAERYDLFVETFALSCLNRLQLRDNTQMVDLSDPAGALQLVGTLKNPIASHR